MTFFMLEKETLADSKQTQVGGAELETFCEFSRQLWDSIDFPVGKTNTDTT